MHACWHLTRAKHQGGCWCPGMHLSVGKREGLVKPVAEVEATLSPGVPLGYSWGNQMVLN